MERQGEISELYRKLWVARTQLISPYGDNYPDGVSPALLHSTHRLSEAAAKYRLGYDLPS